ncbi:MAG: hypothetical protein ICV72_13495 [Aldersonia sp.]|nr:hypothetical protein [Aldersonia sp.]
MNWAEVGIRGGWFLDQPIVTKEFDQPKDAAALGRGTNFAILKQTAQSSTIRINPQLAGSQYLRDGDDTERFSDHFGQIESIVISTGTNDSGLFEPAASACCRSRVSARSAPGGWRSSQVQKFDLETISDVVLHMRYTAREGGAPLRAAAEAHLKQAIADGTTVGSVRVLSLRHDFPPSGRRSPREYPRRRHRAADLHPASGALPELGEAGDHGTAARGDVHQAWQAEHGHGVR